MLIFGGVLQLFIWIFPSTSSILNQKVCRINSFRTVGFLTSLFEKEKPSTPKSHPNMVNDLETVVILSKDAVKMSPYFNILSFKIFCFPRCFFSQKNLHFRQSRDIPQRSGSKTGRDCELRRSTGGPQGLSPVIAISASSAASFFRSGSMA